MQMGNTLAQSTDKTFVKILHSFHDFFVIYEIAIPRKNAALGSRRYHIHLTVALSGHRQKKNKTRIRVVKKWRRQN
jgi:hypothetical protein